MSEPDWRTIDNLDIEIEDLKEERDRLKAINAELLEALGKIRKLKARGPYIGPHRGMAAALDKLDEARAIARAIITKAEGGE